MENTIGERIKHIRTSKKKTQQEFADSLGINRSNVANYENDIRTPVDAVVSLICREYHINETWLRTGEGDMDRPLNRSQEISDFMGRLLQGEDDDFRRRFIHALSRLSEDEWELLEGVALKLAEDAKKEGRDSTQPSDDL